MFFVDTVSGGGPLVSLLGGNGATYVYAAILGGTAGMVAYGKFWKKISVLKNSLMLSYMVAIFLVIIEWIILGWTWFLLDEVVLGALAAWSWLRLKMKTEYLTDEEFNDFLEEG